MPEGPEIKREADRVAIIGAGMSGLVCARTLTGHADKLLGRDVRGDDREADQGPGQVSTGQEVVLTASPATALVHAEADHEREEGEEDNEIEEAQFHAAGTYLF